MKATPPATILLVEDNRLIAATMVTALERAGWRVLRAESVAQARKVLGSQSPDLAVLDLELPDGRGLELVEDIKAANSSFAVLSAYDDARLVDEAVQHGAVSYLVKPVEPNQLVPAIEAALTQAAQLRRLRGNGIKLVAALATGRETGMAVGVLMAQRGLDRHAAFEVLRAEARRQRRKINELAIELLELLELEQRRA